MWAGKTSIQNKGIVTRYSGDEFIIIDDELYDLQESFNDMRIYKIDPRYGLDRKATNGILERINQMMK